MRYISFFGHRELFKDENFLIENIDIIQDYSWSGISYHLILSEKFIEKHFDRLEDHHKDFIKMLS